MHRYQWAWFPRHAKLGAFWYRLPERTMVNLYLPGLLTYTYYSGIPGDKSPLADEETYQNHHMWVIDVADALLGKSVSIALEIPNGRQVKQRLSDGQEVVLIEGSLYRKRPLWPFRRRVKHGWIVRGMKDENPKALPVVDDLNGAERLLQLYQGLESELNDLLGPPKP